MSAENDRTPQPGLHDVTVIVVTYNSSGVIGGLLDSLPPALQGLNAEVLIVDNGSTDATVERLTGRDDCQVLPSANRGYAAGINVGIRASRARGPVLILNPDVRLRPGSVPPLIAAMALPATGIVAPKVLDGEGRLTHSLRREPALLRAVGLNFTGHPRLAEYLAKDAEYVSGKVVDWALGAVLLVSRACIDTVGEWDESFFLYSEETDFCLRAKDLGYLTRFEPRSEAEHIGGQSGQSPETHAMQIVNRVRLYRRRNGGARSWGYFALTVASEVTWALRGHPASRRSIQALLLPSTRPPELACSGSVMPR